MEKFNVEKLISFIFDCSEKYNCLEHELSSLSKNPFSYDRNRRIQIKHLMKQLKNELEEKNKLMKDSTTFKRKELLSFLAEILTIIEEEEYIVTKISDDEDNDIDIVSSVTNTNIVKREYNSYGILEAINRTSDKKVIWLKKKHPHLLDGVELKEKYKVFPQLKELAYQLVDLKLSNPEISDLDRLTIVLENFKNKNIEK